jgi:hypothetical protein
VRITAVEPHRQANRLLRDRHPEWIDSIYRDPAVSLQGTTVRSYLARRGGPAYDLIVLPVLGAFGGTSGVYALREQYGLTLEAFGAAWDALGERGMIAVTVWQDEPPRKPLRLLATGAHFWSSRVSDDHAGARGRGAELGHDHLPAEPEPFSTPSAERVRNFARTSAFDPLLLEDVQPGERDRLQPAGRSLLPRAWSTPYCRATRRPLFDDYLFDIRPATDDRPFFGQFLRWSSIPELRAIYGARELPYLELGLVLARGDPAADRARCRDPDRSAPVPGRLAGHPPALDLAVLLGYRYRLHVLRDRVDPETGALPGPARLRHRRGTSHAARLLRGRQPPVVAHAATRRNLVITGLAIAGLILLYAYVLMPALDLSMSWPPVAKVAAVFLLLAPPAFLMGMMFPLGLRRLAGSDETHIPWACGIDSCLSVSATALATLVALGAGFAFVMQGAAAAYVVVALAGLRLGRAA